MSSFACGNMAILQHGETHENEQEKNRYLYKSMDEINIIYDENTRKRTKEEKTIIILK